MVDFVGDYDDYSDRMAIEYWNEAITNLGINLEVAGALKCVASLMYEKGYTDGVQMHDFCEPAFADTYFPIADSRPTADRLAWQNTK